MHLKKHGMKLVEKNYSSRYGEIDLIMREKDTLVFVEVRLRRSTAFGHPAETINASKRERIRKTAEYYLASKGKSFSESCRFDVVTVTGDRTASRTEWIADAFY